MSGLDQFTSAMGQFAQMAARGFSPPRTGIVSSYDPDAYAIKARLQPDDIETGWMPILVLMAGKGWGVYAAPDNGDQCLMLFQEGDPTVGLCIGFLPSDEDKPPRVETGEIMLIAKDADASIKLKPDGKIISKGSWEHEGTLKVSETIHADGDITTDADVTAQGEVTAGNVTLTQHVHPQGVDSRGDTQPNTGKGQG